MQLVRGTGRSPSTSTRRSFSRIACQTRPGDESTAQRTTTKTTTSVAEREPVEVLRVEDADERSRAACRKSSASPSSPPVQLCGFFCDEHDPGLRERERHHRERDPADAQATAPSTSGSDERRRSATKSERGQRPQSHLVIAMSVT